MQFNQSLSLDFMQTIQTGHSPLEMPVHRSSTRTTVLGHPSVNMLNFG